MKKKEMVSKTISLPITYYAMMEEIKQKKGIGTYEECIQHCISRVYELENIGIP